MNEFCLEDYLSIIKTFQTEYRCLKTDTIDLGKQGMYTGAPGVGGEEGGGRMVLKLEPL